MDLVWCRSGCGRTVHRSCFEDWRATSVSRNIEITCAVCRGPWSTECECEGCIHVVRRVVEGDCTICLEALIDEDGTRLDDLTWCKDGCGKSVHKHCFDVWKTQCQNRRTDATCVMCRVRWNDRCEC
jgi:protein tyrosine phosphatase